MADNAVCKNKSTAISILETIMEYIKSDTQRAALKAVADWLERSGFDNLPDDPEERRALALKIKNDMRNSMNDDQRRAEAAFYLEGIKAADGQ